MVCLDSVRGKVSFYFDPPRFKSIAVAAVNSHLTMSFNGIRTYDSAKGLELRTAECSAWYIKVLNCSLSSAEQFLKTVNVGAIRGLQRYALNMDRGVGPRSALRICMREESTRHTGAYTVRVTSENFALNIFRRVLAVAKPKTNRQNLTIHFRPKVKRLIKQVG